MYRKDYELIARVIDQVGHDSLTGNQWLILARAFRDALEETNPRFDTRHFMTAATASVSED